MTAPHQLPLPLPVRTARARDDYFVSDSNAVAVALVDDWTNWPGGKFLLTGPEGAGKTHLAHVWAGLAKARIVAATDLTAHRVPDLANAPVCVEDADRIAGQNTAEEALFHLHNLTLENGQALMLTARTVPAQWGLRLPDLLSRLQGTQSATLGAPDDVMLSALLAKQLADRQIVPDKDVIAYLVAHMPRGYAAVARVVTLLDAASLSRKSRITRPLARHVLKDMAGSTPANTDLSQTR